MPCLFLKSALSSPHYKLNKSAANAAFSSVWVTFMKNNLFLNLSFKKTKMDQTVYEVNLCSVGKKWTAHLCFLIKGNDVPQTPEFYVLWQCVMEQYSIGYRIFSCFVPLLWKHSHLFLFLKWKRTLVTLFWACIHNSKSTVNRLPRDIQAEGNCIILIYKWTQGLPAGVSDSKCSSLFFL